MATNNEDIKLFAAKLAELENVMLMTKTIPFSKMCTVNREELLGLIRVVAESSPSVFQHSQDIVSRESAILANAEQEYKAQINRATNERTSLIQGGQKKAEQAIAEAKQKADEMIASAQKTASGMVRDAQERAAAILRDAEKRAAMLVSEQEVVARANMEAQETLQNATTRIDGMYSDFYQNIDDMLIYLDNMLSEKLSEVRATRQQVEQGRVG